MRKIVVMLLAGIFLISGTCMASMALVAENRMPQQGDRTAIQAELDKMANVAPEAAATTMVTVTRQDGSQVQMSVADARAALEAFLPPNSHICKEFRVVGTPTIGVEKGNPSQKVITANFQQVDAQSNNVGEPTEDTIRFRDADATAVTAGVMGLVGQLPAELQAKLTKAAVTKTLGTAMVLEDNRRGWMGGRQAGTTQVAESVADLSVTWLHEIVERGVLSEAELLGAQRENQAVDATGRTFGQYVAEHGNTEDARAHGAAMAFTYRFFPKQHGELTVRIQTAMTVFAAKRPARVGTEQRSAVAKKKIPHQFIVPQGTNRGLENCETAKNLADTATFEPSAYGTNAKEMVSLARAAVARGVVPLMVLNSEMEQQIDGLSGEDQVFLNSNDVAWLQGDNLNHKIGGQPAFDIMAGALLQVYEGGKTKDMARKQLIAKGLAIELSALRGDTAPELTEVDALKLFPVPGDMDALTGKRTTLRILAILAAKPPTRWVTDLQTILAMRSVDLAA